MELLGRRYDSGEHVRIVVDRGPKTENRKPRIVQLDPEPNPASADSGLWIAPGLIDLQINGYGGQEFSSLELTVEKCHAILAAINPFGVTRFLPTVTTERFDVLRHALQTLARWRSESAEIAYRIPGFHLEGPYIASEDGPRGAHPKACCRPPDWEEFQRLQEAAGGAIRLVTLSPEYDSAPVFIARAVQTGVLVAIGHLAATAEQIGRAVDAGARLSTHLGNGSHAMLHRLRNYLWTQLAEDRLMASLIADGHHLPPEVVQVMVRAKQPRRCVLVSDMSGQAGQPPGRYSSPFCDVEILPDGKLVVAGQRELLAGATAPLLENVANVMHFAGVDLSMAIDMASRQPAELLGLESGLLEPDRPADLIVFRRTPSKPPRLETVQTIVGGRTVWQKTDT